ncbi:hypothetical protein Tco_0307513 [Tanacetum coccineum]
MKCGGFNAPPVAAATIDNDDDDHTGGECECESHNNFCQNKSKELTHKESNTGIVELSESRVKCCMTNVVNNKTNDNGSTSEKLVSEDIMNDESNTGTVDEGVDSLVNEDRENSDKVMVQGSIPE